MELIPSEVLKSLNCDGITVAGNEHHIMMGLVTSDGIIKVLLDHDGTRSLIERLNSKLKETSG